MLTSVTSVPVRSLTVMVSAPPRALKSIVSTSLRSIVTLATSRENRTRPPLAEMSMFSSMLAPLNSSVSVPAWPSTVSLPSPGFQTNVSSPAPSRATSLPRPPLTRSSPWLPMIMSSPAPPLIVSLTWPASSAGGVDGVVAAPAVDDSESLAPSAPAIVTCAASPLTTTTRAAAGDGDGVVAGRAVDDHAVRLAVALPLPGVPARSIVDLLDVGAGEVVDRDGVGAAQGVELDVLDAVEVHRDVADVAGQRTRLPLAEMSMFSSMLAPLNTSVSVPAWPSTMSLPSPGFQRNVSLPAPSSATSLPRSPIDDVVAVAAEQRVVALAADDRVVAGAAVEGELDDAGRQRGRVDRVVAAAGR